MGLKTKSLISPIILAAGYSSRMGSFKPLLPLGDKSVVERVIGVFQEAGFDDILTVVGYRAEDLTPVLEKLNVLPVVNRRFDLGMFSSILTGVKNLSPEKEAFFIMPVDIPLVKKHTILELYHAFSRGGDKIYYPCFKGRRGHPPLIAAELIPDIIQRREDDNLSLILQLHEDSAVEVEVPNEDILFDIDEPYDHRLLLEKHRRRRIPSTEECHWLLEEKFKVNQRILAHSKKVASVALILGKALSTPGGGPDLDLLYKAGLLHDLLRTRPNHAVAGAEVLREMGYPGLAEIVAEHADISMTENPSISEKEILYLADKLVDNDKIVSVEQRFGKKLKKHGDNPKIKQNIIRRQNKALKIQRKIEAAMGGNLSTQLEFDIDKS